MGTGSDRGVYLPSYDSPEDMDARAVRRQAPGGRAFKEASRAASSSIAELDEGLEEVSVLDYNRAQAELNGKLRDAARWAEATADKLAELGLLAHKAHASYAVMAALVENAGHVDAEART